MPTDMYFSLDGDIKLSPNGDIALTETEWRSTAQQAYIRVMTEPGDYLLYPRLGAELSRLYGMPQTAQTGEMGVAIIKAALEREGRFAGSPFQVKAVPIGPQTLRFDIYIVNGTRTQILLSIEKNLNIV